MIALTFRAARDLTRDTRLVLGVDRIVTGIRVGEEALRALRRGELAVERHGSPLTLAEG